MTYKVTCPYCREPAKLVLGNVIYPHRPDLYHLQFWRCGPCDAYTGCHKSTDKPKGSLANADLRRLRIRAHANFDPLWKSGTMSRKEAYTWLKQMMGANKAVHIGFAREAECREIIKICESQERM